MSLFRALVLLAGVAALSACASVERGPVKAQPELAPVANSSSVIVPAAAVAPVKIAEPVEPSSFTVHFEFAQDDIRASAMQILYGAAQVAKRGKPGLIRVRGFTDSSGKRDFNLKLAQRRAEAVADQLRKLGVAARVEIAAPEIVAVEAGRAKKDPANRKVEIAFEDFPVAAEDQSPLGDAIQAASADASPAEPASVAAHGSVAAPSLTASHPGVALQGSPAPLYSAIYVSTLN